jgi:hypothetical protein
MIHIHWLSLYKYFYIRNDLSTLIEFVWIFYIRNDSSTLIEFVWIFLYQKWFIDIDWVCINILISEMIHRHWFSLYEYFISEMIHQHWLSLYKYFYIRNDSSTLIEFVWIFLYQKWFIDIDWVCINIFISEMIHRHWLSLYKYFYIRNDSSTLIEFV